MVSRRSSCKHNPTSQELRLLNRVSTIIGVARENVVQSINSQMVLAYWLIGREIVVVEQKGDRRAAYGKQLIEGLAAKLTPEFGRGFGERTLRRCRRFFLVYPTGSLIPPELGGPKNPDALAHLLSNEEASEIWTTVVSKSFLGARSFFSPFLGFCHYLRLMRIENRRARAFYEIEAVRSGWSNRELERQINSLLFERLANSRDKKKVEALAREGQIVTCSTDVIKDPMVLEFLNLAEQPSWRESDLEQAIIDHLESFLLEMGKGFCFVARQKRFTLEEDYFFVDLVLYNRLLQCFVLVELKLGKLTHQDLGQIQMYVNYFDRFQREEWEAPTVGVLLCSDKNDTMVKITLPKENERIHASRYQLFLPSEQQLQHEIQSRRKRFEEQ